MLIAKLIGLHIIGITRIKLNLKIFAILSNNFFSPNCYLVQTVFHKNDVCYLLSSFVPTRIVSESCYTNAN